MTDDFPDYDPADNSRKSYDLAIQTMREKLNSFRREQIGDCTLYLGDCRELLPLLPKVDAVVTDPPYGIGYARGAGGKGHRAKTANHTPDHDGRVIAGDDQPFDPAPWLAFPNVIMWGANHYAARLPHGQWLAWNKLGSSEPWDDFSDVEFAWRNKRAADRIFSLLWKGAFKAPSQADQIRVHPTQKPVALMTWCLGFIPDARTILDPFMGSGTTGVACARAGRRFIGVEIDPVYFDIACKRIRDAYAQPDMFVEQAKAKPAEQLDMLGAAE
jgi:site-specific DNA-methyltransferase (adenine-specific)/modification methylase